MNNPEPASTKVKYDPPVIFKKHYLSHLTEDIWNLGPLPLLKTYLFESKVSKVDIRYKSTTVVWNENPHFGSIPYKKVVLD